MEELREPVPLGQKGVSIGGQWATGSRKKDVTSLRWADGGGRGVPAPGPPSAHFLPGSQGMPLSQRDFLTFSGTECVLSCRPLSVLTSLICGIIRPRLPAPGLFLLLSVKGCILNVSDGVGAKWPGERSPSEASCKASLKRLLLLTSARGAG